jgi:predicted nucleic acid-binding protein
MFLIDTSVWIGVFRDRTGAVRQSLEEIIGDRSVFMTRFTQMELLQGCRGDREWTVMETYLQEQNYIEATPDTWVAAARIYYDLQRQGLTVRGTIDCCIAQLAIENELTLVHNDRDFETIQRVRELNCLRFQPDNN